ncbi:MAG: hypothetical protein WCI77_04165 [Candidatus Omnitrophota bacterium]
MSTYKTKDIKHIEQKMEGLDTNSVRYHVLEVTKSFKTSWVALGRALYSVWKDKLYKDWGYNTIEGYVAKEVGIRKPTAMKLLRSYYFLEKEEPHYLTKDYTESTHAAAMPTYENIDLLRKAKNNKELDNQDYVNLKKDIFEKGKDPSQVRRDLVSLIRQRKDIDPQAEQEKARSMTIKRFLHTLRLMKREIEITRLLPPELLKETESLIEKLEAEAS